MATKPKITKTIFQNSLHNVLAVIMYIYKYRKRRAIVRTPFTLPLD